MNFGQLTEAAARRSGVGVSDAIFGTVGDRVNEALVEMANENGAGWDWLWHDVSVPSIAGQAVYTFDAIARLSVLNTGITALEEVDYPLTRIHSLSVINATWITAEPVERMSRVALADYDLTTGSGPLVGWTAEGQRLILVPPPVDALSTYRLRCVFGEKRLVADEDVPLLPHQHHGTLLYLARSLVYEQKQDDERATVSRGLYEKQLAGVFTASRPYGGPGRPPLET